MNIPRLSLLAAFLIALSSLTAAAQQLATAKVITVTGTVTKYLSNGDLEPLAEGDLLREGDAVSATALSSAELVFSNGSEMTIDENTSVNFATMEQQAFGGSQRYEALQADPSPSQTVIELNYGRLSGHVKKLRGDSRFEVETPLGTAAVQGTRFDIRLIFNANREEFLLSVKNIDGVVDIISKNAGSVGSDQTAEVREPVPTGQTVFLRLRRTDPFFDDLVQLTKNFVPTDPPPAITPGSGPGLDDTNDDFGVIVVSPEGPVQGSDDNGVIVVSPEGP